MDEQARRVHEQAIVIDGVCPLLFEPWQVDRYIKGGATAVAPTVGGMAMPAREALMHIGQWHRLCKERNDLMLIRRASDILVAKERKKLGIIQHFQGLCSIEDNLDLLDAYHALGVKVMQLTYNVRNRVGDGCAEPNDAGLSLFGNHC
jgi:membrane dipeptidase